nr:response regulator [uncultured Capnocytophaga sp.]
MSKELKLLYIEDDEQNRNDLIALLQDDTLCDDFKVNIEAVDTFDNAIDKINSKPYHIIILDIYKGNPINGGEQLGLQILEQIQSKCFIPVIFYSGNTQNVQNLKSQIVGVVTKGDDGFNGLKLEIERLIKFNLPFIKESIYDCLEEELKNYFWEIIHKQRDKFRPEINDFSLGYLMLRKFSSSLSRDKISKILGDDSLNKEKVHPMQFYIYPTNSGEYECGEILEKDKEVFVILTPSCDFILREKSRKVNGVDLKEKSRKVGDVLLAKTTLLSETKEYEKYQSKKDGKEEKGNLIKLIESHKTDRYFFLPQTPFIENRIIDFQSKEMVKYDDLTNYTRVAKLDSPYAESMISSFIRYYNRIGYPDIDSELILKTL